MTPTEWISSQYLFDVVETAYVLTTTSSIVAIANPNRIAMVMSTGNSGNAMLSTQANNSTTQGLLIYNSALPYLMKASDVGSLVTRDWFGVAMGINTTITVIEVLFKDR